MFDWFHFLSYVVTTASTPGPNNLVAMSTAGRQGYKKTLPFLFGAWVGFVIVAFLSAVFCSILSALIPKIKTPMMFVGAAYLLYLAWKTYQRSSVIREDERRGGFLFGLILQFLNVKIIIYCILSMEVYILPHFQGEWSRILFFVFLLPTVGFLFCNCWALFGHVFKKLFSQYAKITNTVMALLLVYCAVSLFL
ncbi:MAG: lysine transporter LysE [Ruminococcaceae bacterium]|nr:lysine transporter LysE [Oscillospiraceae bacterium]